MGVDHGTPKTITIVGSKVKVKVKSLSCVRLFVTPWTVKNKVMMKKI